MAVVLFKNPHLIKRKIDKTAALWVALFAVVFSFWLIIAWYTLPGQHIRVLDIMDFFTAFNGDDGYRYFFYRQAFSKPDLYSWDYILPVPMLLDGFLVWLFDADVFWVRAAHAVVAFLSLYLLYRTQRCLGISKNLAAMSVMILALMPVYALHAMSFYGETWLVFFVILVWFLFASEKQVAASIAASCLPLIRPEGFLLLFPLFFYFLSQKKYREFIFLGLAGGVYFFWLVYYLSLEDLISYFAWHAEYREYINHIQFPVLNNFFGFFVSYNALWYGLAFSWVLLCAQKEEKPAWFFWLISGHALLLVLHFVLLWSGNLYYEPRYFVFALPMLTVFFSLSINKMAKWRFFENNPKCSFLVLVSVFSFITTNHFLQNDELRNRYFNGKRLPFYQAKGPVYGLIDDKEALSELKALLDVVYYVIEDYPEIEALFMPAHRDVFYELNPNRIEGVDFVMLPLNYGRHVGIFGGSLFGWHAGGEQYSYYNFYGAAQREGKKIGLYFGDMRGCKSCVTLVAKGDKGVHVVYYDERDKPMRVPGEGEIFTITPR